MLFKKPSPVFGIVISAGFAAYQAGEALHYAPPSARQMISIATASSTASTTAGLVFSPTTFAKVESPAQVVPPNRKFEQG